MLKPARICVVAMAFLAVGVSDVEAQSPAGTQPAARFAAGAVFTVGLNRPLVPSDSNPTETGGDYLVGAFWAFLAPKVATQIEVGYRERTLRFSELSDDVGFFTAGVVVRVPMATLGRTAGHLYALGGAALEHRLGGPYEGDKGRAGMAARAAYNSRSALLIVGAGVDFRPLRLEGRVGWTPWTLSPLRTDVPPFRVFTVSAALSVDVLRWNSR